MQLIAGLLYLLGMHIIIGMWFRSEKTGKDSCVVLSVTMVVLWFLFHKNVIVSLLLSRVLFCVIESVKGNFYKVFPSIMAAIGFDISFGMLWEHEKMTGVYLLFTVIILLCLYYIPSQWIERKEGQNWIQEIRYTHFASYVTICMLPGLTTILFLLCYFLAEREVFWKIAVESAILTLFHLGIMGVQYLIYRCVILKESNEMMKRMQIESRDYMNLIRSQRHDFNLHIHAISGLICNEKYEECKIYVQEMGASAAAVNDIMPVYDAVIGSMLHNMRQEARRRGTDIYYDITYDMQDTLCNGFECNKIIGNLIQNSLDAIKTEEEKNYGIQVLIFKRRGKTVISVTNCFKGDTSVLLKVFEMGYTTKKGHEGIGLVTIKRILKKYGGQIHMELGEETVTFVVHIPNRVTFEEKRNEYDTSSYCG